MGVEGMSEQRKAQLLSGLRLEPNSPLGPGPASSVTTRQPQADGSLRMVSTGHQGAWPQPHSVQSGPLAAESFLGLAAPAPADFLSVRADGPLGCRGHGCSFFPGQAHTWRTTGSSGPGTELCACRVPGRQGSLPPRTQGLRLTLGLRRGEPTLLFLGTGRRKRSPSILSAQVWHWDGAWLFPETYPLWKITRRK